MRRLIDRNQPSPGPPSIAGLPYGLIEVFISSSVLIWAVWELHKTNKEIAADKAAEAELAAAERSETAGAPPGDENDESSSPPQGS